MKPIVSIIMPCYNGAAYLDYSVGSVRAQNAANWELIAIDDGSTDQSGNILEGYAAKDKRIRVFHQSNAGLPAARNRGVELAQGDYLAFLDADDSWHPDFLVRMIAAIETVSAAGMAYCGWQNIGLSGGRGEPFVPPDYESPDKMQMLLAGCRWPVHGALIKSVLVRNVGGFDEQLNSCEDYDLWLRIATGVQIVRVPEVLAYYHHHGGDQMIKNRARIALNHWKVQKKFLSAHPEIMQALGARRIRAITLGGLLERGYDSYWNRDLSAARTIFRTVMKHGYGDFRDWKYMLPALLPLSLHKTLLHRIRRESGARR